jgi:glycosyltransferase involved in cell wall biosynthesis
MENINVLMVLSHFESDLLAGNYRRIFELFTRCSKFGISYSTIEFIPLLISRSFIKKMLGYDLPLYTVYISKGYGKGCDETRLPFLILNSLSMVRTAIGIKKRGQLPHLVLVPDALPSWVLHGFIVSKILKRPLCITIQLVPRWLIESEGPSFKLLLKHFKEKHPFWFSIFYAIFTSIYLKILKDSYLIFVSEMSRREFITKVKVHKETFVNYNGIEIKGTTRSHKKLLYDACFIGFHDERKGVFDLINAWKYVVKKKPDAKLITCGGIKPELKITISKMISELSNNFILKGVVDEETKLHILSVSKIFVFPSKHEAQSIAVGEALGMGLPVVAYDIPALRDAYGDCKALLFCKKGDVKGLSEAILKMLDMDWPDYVTLSNAAKLYIQKKYSWDITMSKEREIYYHIATSSK